MPDVKRVLAVDVADQGFQKFIADFNKWNTQLNQLPVTLQKTSAALAKVTQQWVALQQQQQTINLKVNQQFGQMHHHAKHTEGYFKKIREHVIEIAKRSVAWLGIGGVVGSLFGLGGFMGFMRLAERATETRKQEVGLGTAAGNVKAFQIGYGQFLDDPGSFLRAIARAKADRTSAEYRGLRGTLGIENIDTMDPFEIAIRAMSAIKRETAGMPEGNLGRWLGITGIGGLGITDTQVRQIQEGNLGYAEKSTRGMVGKLAVSREVGQATTHLIHNLELAATQIESTLVKALAPLAEPLGKLGVALADMIAAGISNPDFKKGIEEFSKWIQATAKYMATPQAVEAFKDAVQGVADFAKAIIRFVRWVDRQFPETVPKTPLGAMRLGDIDEAGKAREAYRYWRGAGSKHPDFESVSPFDPSGPPRTPLTIDPGTPLGFRTRQHGGAVGPGATVVGEGGPEIMVSGMSGTVYTLRQLAAAIGMSESSGSYGALGKELTYRSGPLKGQTDRAWGKYQVMGANIASWTKAALGYSMTAQQFLSNPAAQDAVALHQIKMHAMQGRTAEDIAAIWHSGQPYNVSRSWTDQAFKNVRVEDSVARVMRILGGGGGGASSLAGGGRVAGAARSEAGASGGWPYPGTYHYFIDQTVRQNLSMAGIKLDVFPSPGAPVSVGTYMVGPGRKLIL